MALGSFSFSITSDVSATAQYLLSDQDDDVDGVADWIELNYFSDLSQGESSDSDGDGYDLAEEVRRSYNPVLSDSITEGGISRRRSQLTVVNLQLFERVDFMLMDGVLTNFFTVYPHQMDGADLGANTAPALGDWDGDEDLDLCVASSNSPVRIYENIGSCYKWNLTDRSEVFASLGVTGGTPALGDWNDDGNADLAIGFADGTVRILQSPGSFSSSVFAVDYTINASVSNAVPAFGEVTGDGLPEAIPNSSRWETPSISQYAKL